MATEITLVKTSSVITIGRQGESKVREIHFDITDWVNLYGDGTVQLLHKRQGDKTPYPVSVSADDMSTVKWLVTGADTAYSGSGRAEMRYYVDDMLKVSKTWETIVGQTLGAGSPADPPEAEQGWVDKVLQAGTDAENAAKRAANSEALADQFAQQVFISVDQAELFVGMAQEAAEEAKKAASESHGTLDHDKLSNRDFADAHPIAAITGLTKELRRIETIALSGCPIATEDTAGIVRPGSEFLVSVDGTMTLVSVDMSKVVGLEEKLEAIDNAILSIDLSEYCKKSEIQDIAKTADYEVSDKPIGTIVNYYDHEIRIMCHADTEWNLQNVGEGGDSSKYYIGFKAYAPSSDVVSFKESLSTTMTDQTMYYFEDNDFAGIDSNGRKYSIIWLPVAKHNEDGSWTYYGSSSTYNKFIGWHYCVEWYNADGICVASGLIRINLANEDCMSSVEPYYMANYVTDAELESAISNVSATMSWDEL